MVRCKVMKTRLTLRPGQKGTKEMVDRFGDRLVCVRYRYDREGRRRLKTVELIVDEGPWEPQPRKEVKVRVGLSERTLQARVKRAGGRWDPDEKVWWLTYSGVKALDLDGRLVE